MQSIICRLGNSEKTAENLQDESTQELQQNIAEVDEINRRVRANLDKDKAEEDANEYKNQYDTLTNDITSIREEKAALLLMRNYHYQDYL